jgi:hypothetical protein
VAVTTQKLKVLQSIVVALAVDVMKLHVQRLSPPFGDPTDLAMIRLQPLFDQPILEMGAIRAFRPTTSNCSIGMTLGRGLTRPRFAASCQLAKQNPKRFMQSRTDKPDSYALRISSQS